jgi:osmoprotectant transport system permease protein
LRSNDHAVHDLPHPGSGFQAAAADLLVHARDHVALCAAALVIALVAGIAAGSFVARAGRGREAALAAINLGRVVPSLAVLALMIPLIGVGFAPALVALVLLAIPPIAINTDLGLRGVPADAVDAATGMGMTAAQIRRRVVWPQALPVVFSGVRIATVEVIASATLAAFIGGGGLGELIVNGLATNDVPMLLEGAVAVGLLALAAQALLSQAELRLRGAAR